MTVSETATIAAEKHHESLRDTDRKRGIVPAKPWVEMPDYYRVLAVRSFEETIRRREAQELAIESAKAKGAA